MSDQCICLINELISKNKGEISLFNFPFVNFYFPHCAFSTLRVFHTPHSALLIFHLTLTTLVLKHRKTRHDIQHSCMIFIVKIMKGLRYTFSTFLAFKIHNSVSLWVKIRKKPNSIRVHLGASRQNRTATLQPDVMS